MRTVFLITLTTILFSGAIVVSAQTTCLSYPSNSTPPSGYGTSWNVFTSARELLVKTNCPTGGTNLTLTVGSGDSTQAVYRNAYSYRPDLSSTNPWRAHPLSGTTLSGDWLTGQGTASISAPTSASATNPMYFVGYVCTNRSGSWKCGCSNTTCATPNWQLQAYGGVGGSGGGIGGSSACSLPVDSLFYNPFNKISAHHRPIGAGATIALPRGIPQPDFAAGRRSAAYLENPPMTMEQALSRIGAFRLGTSDQGRKGLYCVHSSNTSADGSAATQTFRKFVINSSTESIDRWLPETMQLKVPRGDTVKGGGGVYYPPNPNGGDYTYAFTYRAGGSDPIVDMFTDFVGPISAAIAADDPAGLARAGEMGYSDHGTYTLFGSDTMETSGYVKSAARLRWPGTVLRGFEINPTNPAPIRHSLNAAATRHNKKDAGNGAHIMGKLIVWPAYGVDGSVANENYNRTDQNQGGFPYGTNLRVPVADYATVASRLAGNSRGLAILHALTYYGVYLVDGHGEYVDTPEGRKGVLQMRIDAEVGQNPDGSPIANVVDDVNDALEIIYPYLKPVGNPPLWTELRSQDTGGLPYLGGGGPINGNSINTAYDAD